MPLSSLLAFKSVLLLVSIVAVRLGFNWLVAIAPIRMFPFVVGDAIGDVALLDDNVVDESGVFDGPG